MDSRAMTCPTPCLNRYNESDRRPRFLPCGHILCTSCCEEGVVEGELFCHKCNLLHSPIPSLQTLPIAYIVEDLVKYYQTMMNSSAGACQGNDNSDKDKPKFVITRDPRWDTSSTMTSMLLEQYSIRANFVCNYSNAKAQLDKYMPSLNDCIQQHRSLRQELNKIVDLNESALTKLEREQELVDEHREQGEKLIREMDKVKELLESITSAKDGLENLPKIDVILEKAKDWEERDKERLPDDSLIDMTEELRLVLKKYLKVILKEIEGEKEEDEDEEEDEEKEEDENLNNDMVSLESNMLIDQILKFIKFRVNKEIKVEDPLFKLLLPELIERNWIYAVQDETPDEIRSARLSMYEGQIHIHNLESGGPPDDAYTIKHSDLIDLLDPSSTLTFLDFEKFDVEAERVHIRINSDTVRARQFVLLCAGTWGGSYANTRLITVWNEGDEGECVWGGDYQGGFSIIPGLGKGGEYVLPNEVGSVSGWYSNYRGTRFCITTRANPDSNLTTAFGKVESGLDFVTRIANSSYTPNWSVKTCGVVLEEACLARTGRRNVREEEESSDDSSQICSDG